MKSARILYTLALALGVSSVAHAQGGVRFILLHIEPLYPKAVDLEDSPLNSREGAHFGFGYDHDLEDRLSMGVDLIFSQGMLGGKYGATTLQYRANFHFASTDGPSAYLGTLVGYRAVNMPVLEGVQWSEGSRGVIPIGLRFGVRGGLEGFYADAYLGLNYQIGGAETEAYGKEIYPIPLTILWGVSLGVGWDRRDH